MSADAGSRVWPPTTDPEPTTTLRCSALPFSQYHRNACRRISNFSGARYVFFHAKCSRNASAVASFPVSRSQ
ncbi:MAG: hypothetical protein EOM72_13635 [Opitutae bacterium]|nr:hypothetical protein [Opitutae bacterium]